MSTHASDVTEDCGPEESVSVRSYVISNSSLLQMDVDAGNRPLSDRLETLLDNDRTSDVVFVVGDPEKVFWRMAWLLF